MVELPAWHGYVTCQPRPVVKKDVYSMFNPILDPSGCMKPPVSINDAITQLQKNLKFVQVKHVLTNRRT